MTTKIKHIKTGAVTGNIIPDGDIVTGKLANDAVTTIKISDANITHAKLHTSMDLTGKTVTVATAAGSTNTTAAASTAFVQQELTTLIGGAPGTLDTLNELAAAINNDSNYNSTLTTALATKLPLAGGTMTGALITSGNITSINAGGNQQLVTVANNTITANLGVFNANIPNTASLTTVGAHPLAFGTANTERMRIDSSGTVKISHADTASEGLRVIQTTAARTSGGALGLFYDDQAGTTQPTLKVIQNGTGDILQLFDGANQVVTVEDGGNVGIGTTSPANKLHVKAGASGASTFDSRYNLTLEDDGENYIGIYSPSNSYGGLRFVNASNSIRGYLDYYHGSQGDKMQIYAQNEIEFNFPSVGEQVTFKTGGSSDPIKVGIGTSSPTMPLSVQAASNAYAISMHGRSDGYSELYGASNDGSTKYSFLQSHSAQTKLYTLVNTPLLFGTNSTERMSITNAGIVDIGKAAFSSYPTGAKLNVYGNGEGFRLDGTGATSRSIRFRNVGTNGSSNAIIVSDGSMQLMNEDPNAAMYFNSVRDMEFQVTSGNSTAGHMRFSSYNTEIMTIDGANNRVGIGDTSPSAKLSVGTGNASTFVHINNAASGDVSSGLNIMSGSTTTTSLYGNADEGWTTLLSGGALNFRVNNAVSGFNPMGIDTSGRVKMPYQPGFFARGNTSQWLQGSAGGWNTIVSGIAHGNGTTIGVNLTEGASGHLNGYDTGSDFNVSNGRFTAPVEGKYLIHGSTYCAKVSTSGNDYMHFLVYVNGQQINQMYTMGGHKQAYQVDFSLNISSVLFLEQNDYVEWKIYTTSSNMLIYGDHLCIGAHMIS